MAQTFTIANLNSICSDAGRRDRIAYILYPMDDLGDWIESTAAAYNVTIVAVSGMDWCNVFSPWEAPAVPAGTESFEGKSPEFLRLLQEQLLPQIEHRLCPGKAPERTLVGVSMSGLFALWQWMLCDTFASIASLSGSFWFEGFLQWMQSVKIPRKSGKAFFLLGNKEADSAVKQFRTVADNTAAIVRLLHDSGIDATFTFVPGNHFTDPLGRLDKAFRALF